MKRTCATCAWYVTGSCEKEVHWTLVPTVGPWCRFWTAFRGWE